VLPLLLLFLLLFFNVVVESQYIKNKLVIIKFIFNKLYDIMNFLYFDNIMRGIVEETIKLFCLYKILFSVFINNNLLLFINIIIRNIKRLCIN